jgi:hypothetical protein
VVRAILQSGIISTIAGTGQASGTATDLNGDNGQVLS